MNYSDYTINEESRKELYNMCYNIIHVLDKKNIMHWLDGGSLLGAVRHKGIIPHDDDIDLGIMINDVDKTYNVLKKLKYDIFYTSQDVIKIVNRKHKIKDKFITIDIFTYIHIDDKIILYNPINRSTWINCWHHENDFLPLTPYQFGKVKIKCPNNPIEYLNRMYPNWETEIIIINHDGLEISKYKIYDQE